MIATRLLWPQAVRPSFCSSLASFQTSGCFPRNAVLVRETIDRSPIGIYCCLPVCRVAISSQTPSSWYVARCGSCLRLLTAICSYPQYAALCFSGAPVYNTTPGTTPRWFDCYPRYTCSRVGRTVWVLTRVWLGCDKNMPGCAIAAFRMNKPTILVYGGTIEPGIRHTDCPALGFKKGDPVNIGEAFESYGMSSTGPYAFE
jgi:hypothetical protein